MSNETFPIDDLDQQNPNPYPWSPEATKEEKWPLVVALLIAVPVILVFARSMAIVRTTGGSLSILAGFLMFIGFIVTGLGVAAFLFRKWQLTRRRNPSREIWTEPSAGDSPVDSLFESTTPFGESKDATGREFSVGPGMSLHKRYHRRLPKPKRRI